MVRLREFVFSGEMFFVLFLTSGAFKESVSLGVDLAVVFLVLTCFSVVYRFLRNPTVHKIQIMPIFLFIIFFTYLIFAYSYSSSEVYALDKIMKFTLLTLPSFILPILLIKNSQKSLLRLLYAFVSVSLVLSFFAIYDYFTVARSSYGLIGFNDGNYLGLGRIAGLGVILLITLALFGNHSLKTKLFSFVGITSISIALLLSGSRMPFIAVFAVLIYMIFKSVRIENGIIYIHKGLKYFVVMVGVSVGALIYFVNKGAFSSLVFRLEVLFTESKGGESAGQRFDFYNTAYDIWSNNPLLGTGFGSFGVEYNNIDARLYPHNILLELLSETGIIGAILLIALIVASFICVMKFNKKNSNVKLAIISSLLYLFLNACVSGDINDNRMLFTFIAIQFLVPLAYAFEMRKSSELEREYSPTQKAV